MFWINSTDGTKIAVYDLNPNVNKTIVLVHGWPLSHEIYEYQLELLLSLGYRIVTIDLRGFGKSDVPADGYSYDQMALDLYNVIRWLKIQSFTLVGFSMGGAIVLRYMRLCMGHGVNKLILLSAAAPCWTKREGFPYGVSRKTVDQMIKLARTDRPQLANNISHQLFYSPHSIAAIDWFRDIALSASGLGTVKTAISLRDEDGRQDLLCVHVPTVIIHGDKDQIVPNELAEYQYKHITNSKYFALSNSGHGIMYDELEKFNQIFREVLNS